MKHRKLFLSFTCLLSAMATGKVSQADLDEGLYMFGCTRGHALEPGAAGESDERTWNPGYAEAYPAIRESLLKAETEGRAGWIRVKAGDQNDSVVILNQMLVGLGYPEFKRTDNDDGWYHSLPTMVRYIEQSGLPLTCII